MNIKWALKVSVESNGSCHGKRHSFVVSYYDTGTFITCMKCGVDLKIIEELDDE